MKSDRFDKLLALLQKLKAGRVPFQLNKNLEDAISILAFAPGEYWEIDLWTDGEVYVERFRSDGKIHDENAIEELIALWAEAETPAPEAVTDNASTARK